MNPKKFPGCFLLALGALLAAPHLAAQPAAAPVVPASASAATLAEDRSLNDWLMRMHAAARNRSYVGTFVVSAGGAMSSAKIWHVCQGSQQVERVEVLTGAPRSTFRHNEQVITFLPEHKLALSEKRDSLGLFPELLQSADSRIADFYKVRPEGVGRVAGVEADITALVAKDAMRFGYRVWTERKNGLVVKLQTLDTDGRVLEQAAFSELQLDAPVRMDKLLQMMKQVEGYRVEKQPVRKTTAQAEGWVLKAPVAGFNPIGCYKRPLAAAGAAGATGAAGVPGAVASTVAGAPSAPGKEPLQWIFSDGLASVSIFVEPFDRQRHLQPSSLSLGATQMLTRQFDTHWITVMGEVPMATLQLFAGALAQKK